MFEKWFKLKDNNTNVTTEVVAGFTTFFTMAYIVFVNPAYLSGSIIGVDTGLSFSTVMVATCIAAALGCVLIGILSNYPFAQAPGMGLNAFFLFTMVLGAGLTWQSSFALIFVAGILFIIITATNLRVAILKAIPNNLRYAITAGIGAFIAMLGFSNGGIMNVSSSGMFLGDFAVPEVLVAVAGLIIMLVLMAAKVKGGILIGIVLTTIIALVVPNSAGTGTISTFPADLPVASRIALIFFLLLVTAVIILSITRKKIFGILSAVFGVGLLGMITYLLCSGNEFVNYNDFAFGGDIGGAFSGMFNGYGGGAAGIFSFVIMLFALTMIDMFDTMGTLIGTASKAGFLDKDGNLPRINRALYADAIATSAGAVLGTSTVTTYVESVAGVNAGGRTGLTSFVVGGLFIAALALTPVAGLVPAAATSPALIVVGILMMGAVKKIEWDEFPIAAASFMTIFAMPFFTSITDGIGLGFITYSLCMLVSGRGKEVSGLMYGLAVVFIVYYVLKTLLPHLMVA